MTDECTCDCQPTAGDCGFTGEGIIDDSGVFYVEPSGVHGCVGDVINTPKPTVDVFTKPALPNINETGN